MSSVSSMVRRYWSLLPGHEMKPECCPSQLPSACPKPLEKYLKVEQMILEEASNRNLSEVSNQLALGVEASKARVERLQHWGECEDLA